MIENLSVFRGCCLCHERGLAPSLAADIPRSVGSEGGQCRRSGPLRRHERQTRLSIVLLPRFGSKGEDLSRNPNPLDHWRPRRSITRTGFDRREFVDQSHRSALPEDGVAAAPDVEERLHAEVDAALQGSSAAYEHLPALKLTSRCITETIRLWSPGWLLTRAVAVDTHLGGHFIPAGTTIVFSPYILHHRPDLYPDPERFDPDRWDNAERPAPPRDAFIAFGSGPRKCIGDQFVMIESTLALAAIVSRWQLRSVPGQPVLADKRNRVLQPRGLRMRAVARPRKQAPQLRDNGSEGRS